MLAEFLSLLSIILILCPIAEITYRLIDEAPSLQISASSPPIFSLNFQ